MRAGGVSSVVAAGFAACIGLPMPTWAENPEQLIGYWVGDITANTVRNPQRFPDGATRILIIYSVWRSGETWTVWAHYGAPGKPFEVPDIDLSISPDGRIHMRLVTRPKSELTVTLTDPKTLPGAFSMPRSENPFLPIKFKKAK